MSKRVFVAMSGGVDSSVSAALLVEQGYEVVGVYMKNWSKDLPGHYCPWQEDYQDAKRVATQLGIEFRMYDFEKQYKQKVVDYMIAEYKKGRTPNPDIMCNQEVKFKLFLDAATSEGADLIATGHYSQVKKGQLHAGVDTNKDQSYFLYRVSEHALNKTLLPVGGFTKPEIRAKARELGLVTANKKDSQGICFVGKVGIREFLEPHVSLSPGIIIDQHEKIVGDHDGALLYTLGQRHGLHVGGGLPYYVVGKDMKQNIVYVTTNLQDDRLWYDNVELADMHWIGEIPTSKSGNFSIRTRYRAPLIKIKTLSHNSAGKWSITMEDSVRAVTPGQSAVIYDGSHVLGGGIVV